MAGRILSNKLRSFGSFDGFPLNSPGLAPGFFFVARSDDNGVQGRELHIPSGAIDKVAVDLASIDRLSVDFDSCSVDPVKIDRRLVNCSGWSHAQACLPPIVPKLILLN